MTTSVRSHTKINLGLAIGPLRTDGYHHLSTVYQTLALHEWVTVEAQIAATTRITLSSTHPRVPIDAGNTAWRITQRCLQLLNLHAEVHIHIDKQLPLQGGLGAGSANAIAALIGLECELGQRLSPPERLRLAEEIGSDIPLFLLGGAVAGVGRGEEVYPLPDIPALPCVIALPAIGVSTPQAFRDWDALTVKDPSATIKELSRSIAAAFSEPHSSGVFSHGGDRAENPLLALVRTGIENDFERVVFPQYPFLGEIKRTLVGGPRMEDAAIYGGLSGSGSALFGLYPTSGAAQAAVDRIVQIDRLDRHGVTCLVTRTLPRSDYWRTMMMVDWAID